jgi:exonuclease 3'-5' domain-containing protein 1
MKSELIDTSSLLKAFLEGLTNIEGEPPSLYVDLEGNNLSRDGTLSLVTILVEPRDKVYLIDVTTLGRDAFDVTASNGSSVRSILESDDIIKVFFDIRNDSDALYSLYGVRVRGIWDLQLMELASRDFAKKNVNGLARCIERDSRIGYREKARWQMVKDQGRKLFDPAHGGSYAVFDQRPLSDEIEDYCCQDVAFMPHLCENYREKLCDAWWRRIVTETNARISLSQGSTYNGKGRHMAEAPRGWMNWCPPIEERRQRTLFTVPTRHEVPEVTEESQNSDVGQEAAIQSPADLSKLFEDMKLKGPDPLWDSDSEDGIGRAWFTNSSNAYDSDRDGERDFTACDSECGYCGRCPY